MSCKNLRLLVVAGCLSFHLAGCGNDGGNTSDGGASTPGGGAQGASAAPAYMPEGAVFPTDETVASNAYTPLSRPLFIYVNKASLKKPAVVAYVQYYLSDEAQAVISEVGYVRLDGATIGKTRELFQQALNEAGLAEPTGEISGKIEINGSSTVAPISSRVTEEIATVHPGIDAPVRTAGTSGGFKDFVRGDLDICDASRPIKGSEREACEAANIGYIELHIAIDGLTVVVNPENNWVNGMTVAQLKQIWEPESTVKKWSDVRPDWPTEEIKLFGPDTDSGTFDYFTEVICGETGSSRSDYQPAVNDNVLVNGVAGEKYALGYFGYAYYVENKDRLKALAIAPE